MPSLPPRDNRVLLTVDALKEEILSARISGTLPGERELSQRLHVSRKTLRKAVSQLQEERWISVAEHGRRRQILKDLPSPTNGEKQHALEEKSVVIMAPQPLDQTGTTERFFQSCLNRLCNKSGITLMHRHLDVRHMKRPAYRLQEFVLKNPADLYLIQHSSQPIQQWFASKGVPCLVLGDSWEELAIPSVAGDMAALAVHTVAILQRHNHQRVAMLYPDPCKRGLEIFVRQLSLAAKNIDLTFIKHEETPESTSGAASKLFTSHSALPTAVLTPTIFSTIAVLSAAGQFGLNIPRDLSLLSLTHDTLFNYTQPSISGYEFDMNRYASTVHQSLTDLLLHPESRVTTPTLVMPDFISGGSIGMAP